MMITPFLANILSEFSLHHPAQRSIVPGLLGNFRTSLHHQKNSNKIFVKNGVIQTPNLTGVSKSSFHFRIILVRSQKTNSYDF
jgi:hypothetical protein